MERKRILSVVMVLCMVFSVMMPQNVWAQTETGGSTKNVKTTENPTVLNAMDYGADPSGVKDNAMAIKKVIDAAKKAEGPVVIDFPKGEYQIYPDKIEARELYITNTVGTNQSLKMKKIGFLFEDMENVTLRGNGSMFMFHGKMTTFATINSKNIKFEDFSFDFRTPTVVDVTVQSVEGNTAIMYVPECYDYSVNGTTITWKSDVSPYTGELYWTGQNGMAYKQICDIKTGLTYRGGSSLFQNVTAIEELEGHKLKFTYSSRPSDIVDGKCYQMRPTVRDHAGMFFWKSSGVTLKDINLHFLHGFGIVGQHSENLTLDHVILQTPEGSGRTTAGYADFLQMSGCKGKITVQNCSFSNPHDDPINIHGTFNEVVEKLADNKFKVRYMHGETAGFPNYFVGDEVEFVTKNNLIAVEDSIAKVIDVQGPTGEDGADKSGSGSLTDIIITLDRDLPNIEANTHVVENITYTPEVLIQNNIFKETPTRGILVTTRKKVEIKNNIFDGMGMASIFISNDAQDWRESGAVKDVTIEGNKFYRPTAGYAAILIGPTNPTVSTDATVHDNIKILNNEFYLQNGKVLDAKSVNGVTFSGNSIYRYDPGVNVGLSVSQANLSVGEKADLRGSANGNSHSSNLYAFNGCKEVIIQDNIYDGGLKLGGSKDNMEDSDIKVNTDGIAIGGNAQIIPAVGMVSYETVENDGVIQVSHTGKVTALKDGTAKVRAYTITGGKKFVSDWKTITVGKPENASIAITANPNKETTQVHGEEIQYSAQVTPSSDTVTWAVKDAATGGETIHATMDANGKLTTVSDGAVEIVATTASGLEARKLLVINKGAAMLGKRITVENESNANQGNWKITDSNTIVTKALAGGIWATQRANNIFSTSLNDAENVEVTVKLHNKTQSNYQEAGLLLFKDTDNYVFIGRKHGNNSPKIQVVTENAGTGNEGAGVSDTGVPDELYLKLVKKGTKVQAYYSTDGNTWTERGDEKESSQICSGLKVGFYAAGGGNHEFEFSDLTIKIGDEAAENIPLAFENTAPSASNVTCSYANGMLSAESQFADSNPEDTEGTPIIKWMASSQQGGTYELIPGLTGNNISVPASLAGKYVKAVVIPQDDNGLYGAPAAAGTALQVGEDAAQLPTAVSIAGGKESTKVIGEVIQYQANTTPASTTGKITWSVVDAATGAETNHATIDADSGALTTVSNGAVEIIAATVNGLEARKLLIINKDEDALSRDLTVEHESNTNQENWQITDSKNIRTKPLGQGIWATQSTNNIFSSSLNDAENVEVTIKLHNKTKNGWQEAGLLLFKNVDNYVFIGRKHGGGTPKIKVVNEMNGTGSEGEGVADISSESVYLRLKKTGNKVQAYFSENGTTWTARGNEIENTTIGTGLKVGFYAAGGGNNTFEFSDLTIKVGDGAVQTIPLAVNNSAPSATGVTCSNENGMLHAELTGFTDPENDTEGASIIRWMASSEANGTYELISGLSGNDFYVPALLSGMYVKGVVIPQDSNGLYGAPVTAAQPLRIDGSVSFPASESLLESARITGVNSFEAFNSRTKYYMTTASAEQTAAVANLAAKDKNAVLEVTLNGKEIVKRSENKSSVNNLSLPLVSGANVIRVKVTAEDQKSQTEYGFTILRSGDTNANVTGIQLNNTALAGFSADETDYEYRTANNADDLKIDVSAESAKASVKIAANGTIYEGNSATVSLERGLNDVVITVKPETIVPEKRYHIAVFVPATDNANLWKLEFAAGASLKEEFDKKVKTYEGTATLEEVTLKLQAEESAASIEILKGETSVGTGTGTLEQAVPFNAGMNELQIKVTSEDKTVTETYTLNIRGVGKVMMSDLPFAPGSASGWGSLQLNKSVEGNPIRLWVDGEEKVFASGVGGHADMDVVYNIEGMGFTEFTAYMGLDREAGEQGSITYSIYLDDAEQPVWTSGDTELKRDTEAAFAQISLEGAKKIKIHADKGANNSNDHASIGNGVFYTKLVDKTDLNEAIKTAKTYTPESKYTAESWSALQTALSGAEEVAADANAKQDAIDEKAQALQAAIENMKTKAKETAEQAVAADKEALEAPEIGEDRTVTLPTAGVNGSTITWESGSDAIRIDGATAIVKHGNKPIIVILKATITSGEGEDMVSDTKTFTVTVPEGSGDIADKTELNAAIAEAEKYTEEEIYTEASWSALQTALEEARQTAADEEATEEEVAEKTNALTTAMENLKTKAKEAAEQVVAAAKEALQKPEIGTDDTFTLPTEGEGGSIITWESDNDAIRIEGSTAVVTRGEKAVTVTLTATITSGTGDDMASDTKTFTIEVPALGGSGNEPADRTDLNAAIAEAEKITEEDIYTAESWSVFQTALEEARQTAADEEATEEEITEKTNALTAAMENLKTKAREDAEQAVAGDKEALRKPEIGTDDTFTLPTEGENGSTITWESDNDAIRIEGATATVTRGEKAVTVTLTATITSGTGNDMVSDTKTFTIKVPALGGESGEPADKTGLNAAIAEAEKYIEEEIYTEASWSVFQTALEEARQTAADEEATEEEIAEKTDALTTAIKNLKTKAKEAAEQAVAIDKGVLVKPEIGIGDTLVLPTQGASGSIITWTSNHDAIKVYGGTATVTRGDMPVMVTLTATIAFGAGSDMVMDTVSFEILVPAKEVSVTRTDISKTAKVTVSPSTCTYNGKKQRPKVAVKIGNTALVSGVDYTVDYKNNVQVGKASATITGIGNYMGTVTKTFQIVPKATSIKGKITAKSKGFIVKWAKASKSSVTGYEVQYSTDKKFKKKATKTKTIKKASTTKLAVKKLKAKKKYYVRVRTYKKVKNAKYVSKWSKVKTVTTRK
ncbi:DUF1349 domain-containing protein [Lachnospiraceae bacterium]|nr:DUF1349 domain-containing protein [Lachnospiraceae bacterium]